MSEPSLKQRIIYVLLSSFLGESFFSRKKKIVAEICRQLQSRKKQLTIDIGEELLISKMGKTIVFTQGSSNKEDKVSSYQ